MIFKNLKPITPSQRNLLKLKKKIITQKSLLNHKIKNYKRCFGKNNSGKTTSYNHGGGHKKLYRKLYKNTCQFFDIASTQNIGVDAI